MFSDDSGLEIPALDGRPGVDSAHYSGSRDAKANIAKVLEELSGIEERSGQFRAVITYLDGKRKEQFEGIVSGRIADEESGVDGFGYDPIFIPENSHVTFAEMTTESKNQISHRKRAVEKLAKFLNSLG